MNRLRAGLPRNFYSIPSTFKYFRLLKSTQTNSGYHPTVISIGNRGSFSGVNKPGRGTVCQSQFTAEAKTERNSISSMRPNVQIYLSNSVRASTFSVAIFNRVVPKTGLQLFWQKFSHKATAVPKSRGRPTNFILPDGLEPTPLVGSALHEYRYMVTEEFNFEIH